MNDYTYNPYFDVYSNYLAHHGILGMKWGVRRYQNPDGSLTDKGIKRYRKKGYDLENATEKHTGRKYIIDKSKETTDAFDRLKNTQKELENRSFEIEKKLNGECEKLKNNKEFMDKCQKHMVGMLSSPEMVDDRDLVDVAAFDAVYEEVGSKLENDPDFKRYKKDLDAHFRNIDKEINHIIMQKGNPKIGNKKYRDIVKDTILKDSWLDKSINIDNLYLEGLDALYDSVADNFMKNK